MQSSWIMQRVRKREHSCAASRATGETGVALPSMTLHDDAGTEPAKWRTVCGWNVYYSEATGKGEQDPAVIAEAFQKLPVEERAKYDEQAAKLGYARQDGFSTCTGIRPRNKTIIQDRTAHTHKALTDRVGSGRVETLAEIEKKQKNATDIMASSNTTLGNCLKLAKSSSRQLGVMLKEQLASKHRIVVEFQSSELVKKEVAELRKVLPNLFDAGYVVLAIPTQGTSTYCLQFDVADVAAKLAAWSYGKELSGENVGRMMDVHISAKCSMIKHNGSPNID